MIPVNRSNVKLCCGRFHKMQVGGRAGTVLIAQAHLARQLDAAPAALEPAQIAAIDARCNISHVGPDEAGLRTAQEAHLRFGPRWRVLREARFGPTEGLARLALPPAFAFGLAFAFTLTLATAPPPHPLDPSRTPARGGVAS